MTRRRTVHATVSEIMEAHPDLCSQGWRDEQGDCTPTDDEFAGWRREMLDPAFLEQVVRELAALPLSIEADLKLARRGEASCPLRKNWHDEPYGGAGDVAFLLSGYVRCKCIAASYNHYRPLRDDELHDEAAPSYLDFLLAYPNCADVRGEAQ